MPDSTFLSSLAKSNLLFKFSVDGYALAHSHISSKDSVLPHSAANYHAVFSIFFD